MLYAKRSVLKGLSKKVGILFSKISLSPNQWTLLSLVLVTITFYFLINKNFLISAIIFAFTAAIDMIDGAVARITNKVTIFGAYLDTVIDRLIEFEVILGFLIVGYPDFIISINIWLFFLIFGSMMVTYTKASAFEKGLVKKELKGGILEHPERLLLFLFTILISNYSLVYASYLIVITTILTNITAIQRFSIAIKR